MKKKHIYFAISFFPITICIFLFIFQVNGFANTVKLSPVDIASGKDEGPKDGVFDSFVNPGTPSLVDNGYTEFRIAAEFDLKSITDPIVSATLTFIALDHNSPAQIEIYGYNGDGKIEITDTGFVDNILGNVSGSIGENSLDVTDFITTKLIGTFVGFSFNEALRQPSPITNFFDAFTLCIESGEINVTFIPALILLLDN